MYHSRVGLHSASAYVMFKDKLEDQEPIVSFAVLPVMVSVVIPAYNEAPRIARTVLAARAHADQVIVIDDGSTDGTAGVARGAGALVVSQANAGYIAAIKRGFREASGDVVITLDADGEHRAEEIPLLLEPIRDDKADLVLGQRPWIPRPSERFLNWLANLRVPVGDSGTGFRALRRDLALELELRGRCICGISVLEPVARGARVAQVPVHLETIDKPRRVAWYHLAQVWYVLRWLLKPARKEHR